VCFLGVRGLATSSYIVYNYITIGHTDLVQYICTFLCSIHTMYLCRRLTSIFFWYSSFQQDCGLATQIHSFLTHHLLCVNIITNCMYANLSDYNITAYVNNLFSFYKSACGGTHITSKRQRCASSEVATQRGRQQTGCAGKLASPLGCYF
jgi:hypothetical protein